MTTAVEPGPEQVHGPFHRVVAGQPGVAEGRGLARIEATQRNEVAGGRDEQVFNHAAVGAAHPPRARAARRLTSVLHPGAAIGAQAAPIDLALLTLRRLDTNAGTCWRSSQEIAA